MHSIKGFTSEFVTAEDKTNKFPSLMNACKAYCSRPSKVLSYLADGSTRGLFSCFRNGRDGIHIKMCTVCPLDSTCFHAEKMEFR